MSAPLTYKCVVCGKEEPWGDGWQWFGKIDDDCDSKRIVVVIACSDACRDKVDA